MGHCILAPWIESMVKYTKSQGIKIEFKNEINRSKIH
jgi:hypothetical protein